MPIDEKFDSLLPSLAAAFAATAMPSYDQRFSGDWGERERAASDGAAGGATAYFADFIFAVWVPASVAVGVTAEAGTKVLDLERARSFDFNFVGWNSSYSVFR